MRRRGVEPGRRQLAAGVVFAGRPEHRDDHIDDGDKGTGLPVDRLHTRSARIPGTAEALDRPSAEVSGWRSASAAPMEGGSAAGARVSVERWDGGPLRGGTGLVPQGNDATMMPWRLLCRTGLMVSVSKGTGAQRVLRMNMEWRIHHEKASDADFTLLTLLLCMLLHCLRRPPRRVRDGSEIAAGIGGCAETEEPSAQQERTSAGGAPGRDYELPDGDDHDDGQPHGRRDPRSATSRLRQHAVERLCDHRRDHEVRGGRGGKSVITGRNRDG